MGCFFSIKKCTLSFKQTTHYVNFYDPGGFIPCRGHTSSALRAQTSRLYFAHLISKRILNREVL